MNRENKRKTYQKGYYKTHASDDSFTCKVCGRLMTQEDAGTGHRNHCSNCLSSLHMDDEPGDRAVECGGIMDAIAVWTRKSGEWAIIHRCRRCGKLSSNRIAGDDNPIKLMSIAMKPLALPPFPIERIEEMTRLMGGDGSMITKKQSQK
ncbi:MAG: RNHCP domain-containing protein [Oscillospiraceae bacterium]